jgi:hypothetical protein
MKTRLSAKAPDAARTRALVMSAGKNRMKTSRGKKGNCRFQNGLKWLADHELRRQATLSRAKTGVFAALLTQGRLMANMFRMNGLLAICAICREITS